VPGEGWRTPGAQPAQPLVSARSITVVLAGALTLVLCLAMVLITPPYVIISPGPTIDTLGEVQDEPLIQISGQETHPPEGELRLTTVSTVGGPGYPATAAQVLRGWISSARTVMPREAVYNPEETAEEIQHSSEVQMASSQSTASVAALQYLGHEVPTRLTVAGATPHGPAVDVVAEDDELRWIEVEGERTEIVDFPTLTGVLDETPPETTVTLGITRDGAAEEVEVVTMSNDEGGSLLGIYLLSDADLPFDVSFVIENIGGPSAGLMLALGIIDLLTPGSLAGEEIVAGTGTMGLDGEVGAIGGIRQKLAGAKRDGAQWFLAPVGNCAETVGYVPAGLTVVAVATLDEAHEAVAAIGEGRGEELPQCAE